MSSPRPYQDLEDLPRALPVFPLTGALLLPRAHLPLNIFEPRYLAMVDAALAGNRLIGLIQPAEPEAEEDSEKPELSSVGCAGRLTAFRETEDGRYLITLTGICRFRAGPELKVTTPFRQLQPDFSSYLDDLHPVEVDEETFPRERLLAAFKAYLLRRDLKADWDAAAEAPAETLVGALATLCPFEPPEMQALLEAKTWPARVQTLIALFEMSGAEPSGGTTLN